MTFRLVGWVPKPLMTFRAATIPNKAWLIKYLYSTKRDERLCWKCRAGLLTPSVKFCKNPTCGVIQPLHPIQHDPIHGIDYFKILLQGDQETCTYQFDLDLNALRANYIKVQQKLHPDTFSQKTQVCM
jgi:molecular chaperone HscB